MNERRRIMDAKRTVNSDTFSNAMKSLINHDYGKSVELFTDILNAQPENTIALISRGTSYLRMDDTDSAMADFNSVLQLDPGNARAYHMRGLAHEKRGDNQAALSDFNRAVELNPDYGAAYYSRATLHTKLGQTEQATEDIQMVAHLTNRNIEHFANENNVWRSQHLRLESMLENEMGR
jgi:tetratricopeptide (TPR) repeat protein